MGLTDWHCRAGPAVPAGPVEGAHRMEPLRLGVIGCGVIGKRNLQDAMACERVEVVAAADLRLECREWAAEQGVPRTYEDGRDLLDRDNEKAGLHYWFGVPYWGYGYATEAARELVRHAFQDLGLGRVYADHVARNPASGRVLQKVGMSYEGCLRRDFKKWDRFEDLVLYGMLVEEWGPAD